MVGIGQIFSVKNKKSIATEKSGEWECESFTLCYMVRDEGLYAKESLSAKLIFFHSLPCHIVKL